MLRLLLIFFICPVYAFSFQCPNQSAEGLLSSHWIQSDCAIDNHLVIRNKYWIFLCCCQLLALRLPTTCLFSPLAFILLRVWLDLVPSHYGKIKGSPSTHFQSLLSSKKTKQFCKSYLCKQQTPVATLIMMRPKLEVNHQNLIASSLDQAWQKFHPNTPRSESGSRFAWNLDSWCSMLLYFCLQQSKGICSCLDEL